MPTNFQEPSAQPGLPLRILRFPVVLRIPVANADSHPSVAPLGRGIDPKGPKPQPPAEHGGTTVRSIPGGDLHAAETLPAPTPSGPGPDPDPDPATLPPQRR